jgi:hypothetical protein
MIDQRSQSQVEGGASPYLLQPLRLLDQAQQDRNRQKPATADGTAGAVTSSLLSVNGEVSLQLCAVAAAKLPWLGA